MNRSRILIALALAVMFLAGTLTASAATGDPCNPLFSSNTIARLKLYEECRFDRLDAANKRIEAKLNASPAPTPTSSPSPTATKTPTPTPTPTTTPKPTPTATPTATPTSPSAAVCQPGKEIVKFTGAGSAGLGQYGQGNYDASAELWNVGGYNYTQTMGVCTHDAWYADVKTDNSKGDGAVKAYPSVRRIYHDWSTSDFSKDPLVSSFPRLQVDFAATTPTTCTSCIYNVAFDIWLDGIGNGTSTELMIWTDNANQRPGGSKVASGIKIGNYTWDLWSGSNDHYIAYVPTANIPAGKIDVKDFTADLMARGRLKSTSRLGQISYGVEMVSTNAVTRHFDFTRFTVTDN